MLTTLLAAVALVAAGGAAALGVGSARDRRRHDEERRDLDARMRQTAIDANLVQADLGRVLAAMASFDVGIEIVDAAGRLVLRNAVAEAHHDARVVPAGVGEAMRHALDAALSGDSEEHEIPVFGPPRRDLVVSAHPLVVDGRRDGAVVFVRDTSDAHRVADVRRDFVANVTHELKTPVGALQLLAETISISDDVETVRRLTDRMVREAERLTRIIDDLLDLSSIEAGRDTKRERVVAAEIVAQAVERVGAAAGARGIGIVTAPIEGTVVLVCDRHQVTSALANLLDNAVKYSEPGAAPVRVEMVEEPERVGIRVRDHGIGIPTRDLERVFERFYRVDRARSRDTGGTGLGLAIVRHVMQAHDGEVTVASHEGEGSTFTLWFPRPGAVSDGGAI